jgi:hypothetical protein
VRYRQKERKRFHLEKEVIRKRKTDIALGASQLEGECAVDTWRFTPGCTFNLKSTGKGV